MIIDTKNGHGNLEHEAQLALDAIKNAENMFNYSDDQNSWNVPFSK